MISVSPPESPVLLPATAALQPSVCLPDGQFDYYRCSARWWRLLQLPGSQHRWQCYYQSTAGGHRLWVKGRCDGGQMGGGILFSSFLASVFCLLAKQSAAVLLWRALLGYSLALVADWWDLPYRCGSWPRLPTVGEGFQEILLTCWAQNCLFPWRLCVKSVWPYLSHLWKYNLPTYNSTVCNIN